MAAQAAGVEAAARAWQQHSREAERCTYEASMAERRYRKACPDNHLVEGTLKREWELALQASARASADLEQPGSNTRSRRHWSAWRRWESVLCGCGRILA